MNLFNKYDYSLTLNLLQGQSTNECLASHMTAVLSFCQNHLALSMYNVHKYMKILGMNFLEDRQWTLNIFVLMKFLRAIMTISSI